jgi:hypothetical protein
MRSDDDHPELSEDDKPKKRRWWLWALGLLLLVAFCDGDDDGPRRFCYDFSNGEHLCFDNPLPADQYCYIEEANTVRCYDEPQ